MLKKNRPSKRARGEFGGSTVSGIEYKRIKVETRRGKRFTCKLRWRKGWVLWSGLNVEHYPSRGEEEEKVKP